jgi:hypothetical protein
VGRQLGPRAGTRSRKRPRSLRSLAAVMMERPSRPASIRFQRGSSVRLGLPNWLAAAVSVAIVLGCAAHTDRAHGSLGIGCYLIRGDSSHRLERIWVPSSFELTQLTSSGSVAPGPIGTSLDSFYWRQFALIRTWRVRFGDTTEIRLGSGDATVTMRLVAIGDSVFGQADEETDAVGGPQFPTRPVTGTRDKCRGGKPPAS